MAEINNVIAEASQDLQTIEDFVNLPAGSDVRPRLLPSVNVGTLAGTRDAIFEAGGLPATPFATKALMTASALVDGNYAMVTDDDDAGKNRLYVKTSGAWATSKYDPVSISLDKVYNTPSKNLFDKRKAVANSKFSPAYSKVVADPTHRRSNFIEIEEGETYTASGTRVGIAWFADNNESSTAIDYSASLTATAPVGAKYALFNITASSGTDPTPDDAVQFEKGAIATAYEPYMPKININDVSGLDAALNNTLRADDILTSQSFNLIDPSKVDYVNRIAGSGSFAPDNLGIASSDWIAVKAGEWYTLSGEYYGTTGNPLAAYFNGYGVLNWVQLVTYVEPVSGGGLAFKVPTGLGITHAVVSLRKKDNLTASRTLNGNVQLEKGEMATTYRPYAAKPSIKPELLPDGSGSGSTSVNFEDAAWYKYINADGAKIYQDKLPKFRKTMLLKDKDLCVVMTGTSLTARTSEHSTLREDASTRPPMMHSNAFCSLVWDAMKWSNQQYRRYDAVSTFTETGAFLTSSSLAEWDDGSYRDGLTRYSAATSAAVSFSVPIDAWQFNFIYRTDSLGCAAKVAIAQGNGKMQVYDDATSAWLEANNYAFSMLEAEPVSRSVTVGSIDGGTVSITTTSASNTTYQKRLKMRCKNSSGLDSLATAKTVTISRTGGGARFMYWGVEYSAREFMISYINSSRGSYSSNALSARGLPRVQDNEVWSFKPDLILSELAIHNDGAASDGSYPVGRYAILTENHVDKAESELSLYSRATHFGLEPEYAFFMGSITWNFNGINEDGSLKAVMQTASSKGGARVMTALDKYQEAVEYLRSKDIIAIDTAKHWVNASNDIYGDLKTATLGSGKDGNTLTNEGSHWNDTGSKVMAKAVLPII